MITHKTSDLQHQLTKEGMGGNESSTAKSEPTGPEGSRPALNKLYSVDLESSFIMIGNRKLDFLNHHPEQTHMVAYGIDKQTNPKFSKKTLSSVTVLDAYQVCMALVDKKVVPKDHVQLFAASKDLDRCTARGMKESFQTAAKQTGKDGILFFHFSGHGIKVGNEWGMAPADFDYTRDTFLTGDVLNGWLNEVDCQALYVVISLDCCYASGLANELTRSNLHLRSGTYVLSACTAFETSLVIGPLGHSVYAYFLSYAIRVISFSSGELPIHRIFDECSVLCRSLTSFLVSYHPSYGLNMQAMQPVLRYFDVTSTKVPSGEKLAESVGIKRQDSKQMVSMASVGRYSFVSQYFTELNFDNGELCSLCLDWLGTMTEEGTHLKEIASRGLLRDEILDAVICLMMWSFASIQLVEDKDNVHKASHFLLAFLYTAFAIDSLYHVQLTHEHMKQGLEFYLSVIEDNEVDIKELCLLRQELDQEQSTKATTGEAASLSSLGTSVDPLESIKFTKYSGKDLYGTCPVNQTEGVCKLPVSSNWWVPLSDD